MKPVVYFPIEVQHRELPSRLLIAVHLLAEGFHVVIGSHWSLVTEANQAAFPPGLYLFKTVNRIQGNAMRSVVTHGHLAAANDEEVLNAVNDGGFLLSFADNAAAACGLFFAQSEGHRDAVIERFPHLAGKVRVVGNPRIDLMLPVNRGVFEVADPRVDGCKPYILFNTNYGTINSVWNDRQGVTAVAEAAGALDGDDRQAKIREFEQIVAWEKTNFLAMTALLTWTVENVKGLNIVVRPHPAERTRHWEKALAGLPDTHLIPRSDPHPWILGAKLVVHTGCTTGLEAVLLGRDAVNLLPTDHPTCDRIVTYVNPTFRTWQDAAAAITSFFVAKAGPIVTHRTRTEAALERYLPSYRDNASARLMAEGLAAVLAGRGAQTGAAFALRSPYFEKPINELMRQKYDATEADIFKGLANALRLTGIGTEVRVSALGNGTFLLSPA